MCHSHPHFTQSRLSESARPFKENKMMMAERHYLKKIITRESSHQQLKVAFHRASWKCHKNCNFACRLMSFRSAVLRTSRHAKGDE